MHHGYVQVQWTVGTQNPATVAPTLLLVVFARFKPYNRIPHTLYTINRDGPLSGKWTKNRIPHTLHAINRILRQ